MATNSAKRATGQENYETLMGAGVLISLLLVIGLSVYWFGDRSRLASAADDLRTRRIQNGQQIFNEQCTACHGTKGKGGTHRMRSFSR